MHFLALRPQNLRTTLAPEPVTVINIVTFNEKNVSGTPLIIKNLPSELSAPAIAIKRQATLHQAHLFQFSQQSANRYNGCHGNTSRITTGVM